MRKRCLDTVCDLARKDKDVVFIGSDLGYKSLQNFELDVPGQFFMEGISEGHIVSMAAGMALSGKKVYINTIATFITRRSYEQNAIDLGLTKANVRLIGSGGGLVYAPLGSTHLATEDVAIMRAIPNMCVIAPSDAEEMERAVRASHHWTGPIYFRVAKGGDPVVSKPEHGFEIGKAIVHNEAKDALIVTYGVMVDRALKVAEEFSRQGVQVGVMNCHTLKPFDYSTLRQQIEKTRVVLTLEEHSTIGGLGSIVSEIIAEEFGDKVLFFKKMALPDIFPDLYGSQNKLIEHFGLDVPAIFENLINLLKRARL